MKKFFLFILSAAMAVNGVAQVGIGRTYIETTDNYSYDRSGWGGVENGLYATWGSRDAHYLKYEVPATALKSDTIVYAWRGERVSVAAVLFSKTAVTKMGVSLSEWQGADGTIIPAEQGWARFVRYVLSDQKLGCGANPRNSTTLLRPDVIDVAGANISLPAKSVRPVWVTLEIPRDATPGDYKAKLTVTAGNDAAVQKELNLTIRILDKTLPEPANWSFRLDYWQQPFSVARYYNIEKWSKAHFDALRPFMEMLRRAGQRCVTATLFYEPWGEQSNDPHDGMVQVTKKTDGTWSYDYTVFDRWVEFAAECGISEQINCYSMIPWNKTFRYYDEAQGQNVDLVCNVGSAEYVALWTPFLQAFAAHLKEKGWFEKTCIAMDERGLGDMLSAYNLLQQVVPGMNMVLAGNHHGELLDKLSDYSIASGQRFTAAQLAERRAKGWHSTAYYCCTENQPNTFTSSLPAEGAYWPLFCIANDFDGLLHWSFIDWTNDPLRDSRFKLFPPGDTYVVYPGPRSSVRYERLIEGIQATEKVRMLRATYDAEGNTSAREELDRTVALFADANVTGYYDAAYSVNAIESLLNGSPQPVYDVGQAYCNVSITNQANSMNNRFLRSVRITEAAQNATFTSTTPSANGYVIMPGIVKVNAGSTFRLRTTADQNEDDLRYCRLGIYADWNGDSVFALAGEEAVTFEGVAKTANTSLLNGNYQITVPAGARPGQSRIRLVYNDAWSGDPRPCGEQHKGYVFDIPIEIISSATGIKNVSTGPHFTWKHSTLRLQAPADITVYSVSGVVIDQKQQVRRYTPSQFLPGSYILVARDSTGTRSFLFKK